MIMDTDLNIIGIILGNGFDIAYGYKSGYRDFLASDFFKKLLLQGNNLAKYISILFL